MLFRKMIRDLLKNKVQFLSIFLMSFVGMAAFAGLDAESTGGFRAICNYYDEYNLADYWVDGGGFDDDEVRKIEALDEINSVEKRSIINGKDAANTDHALLLHFIKTNSINKCWLVEGTPFEEGKEGFWIEKYYAKANNLSVGDNMSINIGNERIDGIVKGIGENPEYVYYILDGSLMMPDYGNYSFVYLSDEMHPDRENLKYTQLIIDAKEATPELKERIEDILDRKDVVVTDRRQNTSFMMFDDELSQHKAMGVMFSIVFLLIAFLGIVTTMTRVTANQRIQIGTLKALGFSKRTITLHYISYGVLITALGDIIGAYVGMIGFPGWIFPMFEEAYLTPKLSGVLTPFSVYGVAISVLLAALVSFLSCRKQLKDMPAITLKPEAPKFLKANFIERSSLWQKLPFSTQWNFRDIARNKIRTLMGVVGIAGCTMIMFAAFSCNDSILGILDIEYKDIATYTTQVSFEEAVDNSDRFDYARKYKGQLIQSVPIEVASLNVKENETLTVIGAGGYVHTIDRNGHTVKLTNDGIALTDKACKNLGVKEGDFIKWHITGDDKWQYTRINQVVKSTMTQGIYMTRDTFENFQYTFTPTSFVTNITVPKRLIDDDDNIMAIVTVDDLVESLNRNLGNMLQMVILLVVCAVLLGVIVLYNLGILSFTEKTREVATLKVLGFGSRKIRNILQEQNIWISLMGIFLGVPLGKLMMIGLCATMSSNMDFSPVYSAKTYIYSVGGTFIVSILVNFMFSGKVKTINMVDALKGVE